MFNVHATPRRWGKVLYRFREKYNEHKHRHLTSHFHIWKAAVTGRADTGCVSCVQTSLLGGRILRNCIKNTFSLEVALWKIVVWQLLCCKEDVLWHFLAVSYQKRKQPSFRMIFIRGAHVMPPCLMSRLTVAMWQSSIKIEEKLGLIACRIWCLFPHFRVKILMVYWDSLVDFVIFKYLYFNGSETLYDTYYTTVLETTEQHVD